MKKVIAVLAVIMMISSCDKQKNVFEKSWTTVYDRVWAGSEFWSNRLQDWRIADGRLECIANSPKLLMRTTHLVNCRLADTKGTFFAQVESGPLQSSQNSDAACGFLLGAGSDLDVLGASLIQQKTGPGGGLFAGISSSGTVFIRDMENGEILVEKEAVLSDNNILHIEAGESGSAFLLSIECGNTKISREVSTERLCGNIALVSHPGTGDQPGSFWFNKLAVSGSKLMPLESRIGPIISTQYTLSENILKMTAQMAPVSKSDPVEVYLETEDKGKWERISTTEIITPGYTATFKVTNWDSSTDTQYRVVYFYRSSVSDHEKACYEGMIRHDPTEKEEIVVAAFTGNHNNAKPGLSGTKEPFNFNANGIWYPHTDLVNHVRFHHPDLLFFSGDQVYETMSPTSPDRDNYELDYLYKWYLYCLAYRDITRDIPTISIPDDHDVFQGNLWGQGGRYTNKDDRGGYVNPAWFIKMLERTQCSNLPDPFDPTPIEQEIGVYYTSLCYGGIGIAVLEDRKFKSGCADNPFITKGRSDHVIDPSFDVRKIDLPGKKLLGDRQLAFLGDWATDWKGQEMKIALSQTIFANMATHHGEGLFRLIADLDSNGWPQSGRNKAVDALRKAYAFHIAGDQHLGSMIQHGIDQWDDGIYSFCVPSIANFYPRAWWPESAGIDRPENAPRNMGKHKDGFGNLVTVYGVTNPSDFTNISTGKQPLELHDKMPGYGIVKLNKAERTIEINCWPRAADPAKDQQYEGWPKTISQFDNYGRKAFAYLPTVKVTGTLNPVIEITDEASGELVYCVRISGTEFKPKVFAQSSYSITLKDTDKDKIKEFRGLKPAKNNKEELLAEF